MLEYTIGSLSNRGATYFYCAIDVGRYSYTNRSLQFFLNKKVKKSKKVFDKGQKVRYTLTIEKNKKSKSGCLFHHKEELNSFKKSSCDDGTS